MMYGQMTAGSWIYIGTQGILQGTYETFAEAARQHFGGTLAGTVTLTAGLGGMGGAQPLAVTMNEGVCLAIEVDPARAQRRLDIGYVDRLTHDPAEGLAWAREAAACARRRLDRAGRQRRRDRARLGRRWRALRSRDRPDVCPRCPVRLRAGRDLARRRGSSCGRRSRRNTNVARGTRWRRTSEPCWPSSAPVRSSSTTATTCVRRRRRPALMMPLTTRASCRRSSGPSSARAAARSAGPPSRATRPTSSAPTGRCSSSSPTTTGSGAGSRWPRRACPYQGLPARICWLGYGERSKAGLAFNELVASGEVSAPIVIGRDHLDAGSVAIAQPGDRGDGRRLRRGRRLAVAQRARQHGGRRVVGVDPSRRRRRASATPSTPGWSSSRTGRRWRPRSWSES